MQFCYIHKDQEAKERCERCNEWICEKCIQNYTEYGRYIRVCPKCYQIFMDLLQDFDNLDF